MLASVMPKVGCPVLYSYNRDRSPHNRDLTRVSSICSSHYRMKTEMGMINNQSRSAKQRIKSFVKQILPDPVIKKIAKKSAPSVFDYQHMIGYLND